MLQNHLKVILRNIQRNKLYAAINILGLALGFASLILVIIYLHYETSFEDFHTKADRIYRPTYTYDSGSGYSVQWARIPVDYINELPNEFPEVEKLIRFQNHERKYIHIGVDKFRPDCVYQADPEVFEVFNLPMIAGNPKTALKEPYSMVITESLALTYFGNLDILGNEVFVLSDWNPQETQYKITGVIKDLPSNTHLPIEMLLSFNNAEERSGWAYVYVQLQDGAQIEHLKEKLPEFIHKYAEEESTEKVNFNFQPLKDIHLHSNLAREIVPNGNIDYIFIFLGIGVFILVIALANFTNLQSAMVIVRTKETGLRKIYGAGKGHISKYMLFESVFYNLLALIIGSIFALLVFPYFKILTNINFIIDPWRLVLGMIFLTLFCGTLTGIFPAIHINNQNPIANIKQSQTFNLAIKNGSANLKRTLIALQFSISILLIGSAFIVRDQFNFLNESNLGINQEQILAIPGVPDKVRNGYKIFKDQLLTLPGILGVTACLEVPSREIRDVGPVLVQGVNNDPDKAPVMDIQTIDHDYLDVLGIQLLAGKNIPASLTFESSPEFTENFTIMDYFMGRRRAYLINETAMKQLGWQSPNEAIGREISWSIGSFKLGPGPVTGVVKDYHQETLKNSIDPTIMVFEPIWLRTFLIKIKKEHIRETFANIKATWDQLFPLYPMEYHFLDDLYEELYKNEQVKLKLLYMLSGLAIIISFGGLFGLVTYTLKTRIKEIAIRQILGADIPTLIKMISREYLWIMVIATLIAIPVSYYFVDKWLQQFAYKTDISAFRYVMTILLIGFLILLTTSLQTIKTSLISPAKTLREE